MTMVVKSLRRLGVVRLVAVVAVAHALAGGSARAAETGLGEFNADMKAVDVAYVASACRAYAFWPEKVAPNAKFLADVYACRGDAPSGTDPGAAVRTALTKLASALAAVPLVATEPRCEVARAMLPAPSPPTGQSSPPVKEQVAAAKKATVEVQVAVEILLTPPQHTTQTFEAMALTPDRVAACGRVTLAIAGLYDATLGPLAVQADQERVKARMSDVFRKAESLATAGSAANALNEIAGSPDKVALALMGALGAEQKNDGNRLVFTVNLASLIYPDTERLKKMPAWQRGLLLRVVLPTGQTADNGASVVGASATTGSRLTLQLGGDFVNSSDPRLPEHNACYLAALSYVPVYGTVEKAAEFAEERAAYLDICHKLAAARQRLAWRAGVGMLTDAPSADSSTPARTRVELYAGALVWAPSALVTTNLIYQHVRIPTPVDTIGAGLSIGTNVGGALSGVDAWGRVGIDALGFAQRVQAPSEATASWQWQARVGLTIRARIAGGAFTTVSVGPRFFGDGGGNTDLLSTVSLTYDIDQLLTEATVPLPLIPVSSATPL